MLQRSVTLIRRFRCTRPKVSISILVLSSWFFVLGPASFVRLYPFGRAVGPILFLPDGHDLFERVDQPLASLERLAAMGGADGDGDGGFAQFQTSDAVHGVLSASVQNVFWGGIGGRGGLPGSAGPGMSRRADFAAGVSLRADSEGRRSRTIRSSARVWRRSSVSASVLLS